MIIAQPPDRACCSKEPHSNGSRRQRKTCQTDDGVETGDWRDVEGNEGMENRRRVAGRTYGLFYKPPQSSLSLPDSDAVMLSRAEPNGNCD